MILTEEGLIIRPGRGVGSDSEMENNGTLVGEEKDNRKVDGSFLILNFMTLTRGA